MTAIRREGVDPRLREMVKDPGGYFQRARERASQQATREVQAAVRGSRLRRMQKARKA